MRWPLLLLILIACAAGLVACGGDDVDVDKTLAETFGENKDIKSGRLDLGFRLDAKGNQGLNGPVSVRLAGPFESTGADQLPKFAFQATLDAGGQAVRAGATSTGEKGYVTFQGENYVLPDNLYEQFKKGYAQQAKQNQARDEGVSFKALGVDPRRWLTDPEVVSDDEEVGGVETIHIRAGVDVPKLLEDVNRILARAERIQGQQARQLTEAERKRIADAVKDPRIDIWTGKDDKILRRLNVQLRFEVPESSRQQARGLQSGSLRFDLTLADINKGQSIETPKDAKPLNDLLRALGQNNVGSGGGDTGSGATGGTQSPPQGAAGNSEYQQCVQAAGGDIRKLQDCADLVGG